MAEYPQTWYVYTYSYPDGTPFYVGKGTSSRISVHESEAKSNCQCQKCQIIRGIWEKGQPVQKRFVFETFSESEALDREKELIAKYTQSLVNKRDMPKPNHDNKNVTTTQQRVLAYQNASDFRVGTLGYEELKQIYDWVYAHRSLPPMDLYNLLKSEIVPMYPNSWIDVLKFFAQIMESCHVLIAELDAIVNS